MPILYVLGFVVLAGAIYFLWQNPPEARLAAQDAGKVDTLQAQVESLRDAVARLEQQKPPTPAPTSAEFQQLQAQVNALAAKPSATEAELQQLQQQMLALANKPIATPDQLALLAQQLQGLIKQEPDLKPLTQRIDALESRPQFDASSLTNEIGQVNTKLQQLGTKQDAADAKFAPIPAEIGQVNDKMQQLAAKQDEAGAKLGQSVKDLQARVDELQKQQQTMAQRAQLATKLQGVSTSLAAGQKLGAIPGAPPALARFATEAPPTEAALRASFDKFAADAQAANQPGLTDNEGFAARLWTRAQQSVTVRQGDHVLVGDPIAGVIAHAREQLDNGNLAGAVETVKALSGAAAKAMQPWVDQATALLDARAAIATMVAG